MSNAANIIYTMDETMMGDFQSPVDEKSWVAAEDAD